MCEKAASEFPLEVATEVTTVAMAASSAMAAVILVKVCLGVFISRSPILWGLRGQGAMPHTRLGFMASVHSCIRISAARLSGWFSARATRESFVVFEK